MIYCFDIDGTICSDSNGKYENAYPYENFIFKINKLYDDGNIIKIMTARGAASKKDYTELTVNQLKKWGLKYHELIMNKKPNADLYIDDKSCHPDIFFKDLNDS
jgi:uncharacterized HAD superfamily protein